MKFIYGIEILIAGATISLVQHIIFYRFLGRMDLLIICKLNEFFNLVFLRLSGLGVNSIRIVPQTR